VKYKAKRKPRAHQAEALEIMEGKEAFGLFMAMRTGKTKTTTDDFGRLWAAGKVDDFLLIAPAGVYKTWPEAMDDDLDPSLEKQLDKLLWGAGSSKTARGEEALAEFVKKRRKGEAPRALFINIEALSMVERAQRLVSEFVRQRRCYVVIDESTSIKEGRSKRSKFLISKVAPHAAYRRILSGLPTPQSPLDIYAQFNFLQPEKPLGFSSFVNFRARYAIVRRQQMGARWFDLIVGYRFQEELAERIKDHSFRVTLEDCYDLPESDYQIRHVALTKEQKEVYGQLRDRAVAVLSDTEKVTADLVITQLLRMHQVLSGVAVDSTGKMHAIPENRTGELMDLLEEYDGKAVIWCAYDVSVRQVVAQLERKFGEGSTARFWGGNAQTREDEEWAFKNKPECRFMVATAAAGGRGRTWSVADLTVYHSNTHNLEHRSQSEERVKGIGKESRALYVDLVAPDTVDEKILLSLKNKINLAAVLTGDAWRQWVV
jgi:SNF2 family DNA or RNA helicase